MKSDRTDHISQSHNFDALNKAIDIEVDRANQLTALYQSKKGLNKSVIFLYVAAGISILLITMALIYWLMIPSTLSDAVPVSQNKDNSVELKTIFNNNENAKNSIDTSFTVFTRQQIETGEYVVTGKNYSPGDLKKPTDQYCYIEPITADSGMAGEPIASYFEGSLTTETSDKFLLENALNYCQFTK